MDSSLKHGNYEYGVGGNKMPPRGRQGNQRRSAPRNLRLRYTNNRGHNKTYQSNPPGTARTHVTADARYFFFFFFFFHLTYSRWTSSLPSCLWSQRIFPSLPGSRLTIFYRDASSALLQLVNQWLNFTYSRSHAFRYERKNTNPTLVRIELATSVLADVQLTY